MSYNAHTIKFILLKRAVQWGFFPKGCAIIIHIQFQNTFVNPKRNPIPISSHSPSVFIFDWPTNKRVEEVVQGYITHENQVLKMDPSDVWRCPFSDEPACGLLSIFLILAKFFLTACKSQLLPEQRRTIWTVNSYKCRIMSGVQSFIYHFTSFPFKNIFPGFWFILLVNNNKTLISYLQSHGQEFGNCK